MIAPGGYILFMPTVLLAARRLPPAWMAAESFDPRLIWDPDMTRGNHDA